MLQGPAAALWRETRDALVADGHRVLHVSLALGDRLFWRRPGRIDYHGRLEDWPAWLAALVAREGVSDILYFRDCLPYHRAAAALAETRGLRAWAIENGYLRPDWLTMEPFGMGRHSRFTRRAETIRALAAKAPAVDMAPRFRVPFPTEARCEMAFNLAHALGKPVYRGWTDDRPVPAWREYLGWVPYLARRRRARREAEAVEARCRCAVAPYTLVALQMETDYQVRVSSAFGGQAEMLELVMLSFARRAAAGHRLVIKIHPFDNGLIDWRGVAAGLATRFGVEGRVDVIRGGRLDVLLARAHGLVTINSTTAVHALRLGRPVMVLGDAVFDVAGITHQGGLDRFWGAAEAPDPAMVDAWCRAAAAEIQVRGSQMHPAGRRAAAAEIAQRLAMAERYWRLYRDGDGYEAAPIAPAADAFPAGAVACKAPPLPEIPRVASTTDPPPTRRRATG